MIPDKEPGFKGVVLRAAKQHKGKLIAGGVALVTIGVAFAISKREKTLKVKVVNA